MALPVAGPLGSSLGCGWESGIVDAAKRAARLRDALDARARPAYLAFTMTVFAPPATSTS